MTILSQREQIELLAAVIIAAGAENTKPKNIKAGPLDDAIMFLQGDGTLDPENHCMSGAFKEAQKMAREYQNGE